MTEEERAELHRARSRDWAEWCDARIAAALDERLNQDMPKVWHDAIAEFGAEIRRELRNEFAKQLRELRAEFANQRHSHASILRKVPRSDDAA
jgi:hypothetical protein